MWYHLTAQSRNIKTGPMPVATSAASTCPDACPLKGAGCYAESGPLAIHWRKISSGKHGEDFESFLKKVAKLPRAIWRYGQAGDLPGDGDRIDREGLLRLARANRGRPVIAYTHKPPTVENLEAIQSAVDLGFHINLSANNLADADRLLATGHSVVTVLPSEYARIIRDESLSEYRARLRGLTRTTPQGRKVIVCPATYANTDCQKCKVCAHARSGGVVVGFPAHGTRKSRVNSMASEGA